ncbi:MAG: hypothetical protein NT009_05600 [Proteobacteria bacterium]|nr:hypothetical protein [Pseudomonadota bacterium]
MTQRKFKPEALKSSNPMAKALSELIKHQIDAMITMQSIRTFENFIEIKKSLHHLDQRLAELTPVASEDTQSSTQRGKRPMIRKDCRIPGCWKPAKSRGLCGTHYQAARRKRKF